MLRETRALRVSHDRNTQRLEVEFDEDGFSEGSKIPSALLLSARRDVVGLDLNPEGTGRLVVMAGAHEDVVEAVPCEAEVRRAGRSFVARVSGIPSRRT